MKNWMALALALLALLELGFLARHTWIHLEAGYSLRIGFEGQPTASYRIVFPLWHKIAAATTLTLLAAGIVGGGLGRPRSLSLLAAGIAAVATLRLYDVWRYGTMGAPTPDWTLVFAAALGVAALAGRKLGALRW